MPSVNQVINGLIKEARRQLELASISTVYPYQLSADLLEEAQDNIEETWRIIWSFPVTVDMDQPISKVVL